MTPRKQLNACIARYSPGVAKTARAVLRAMDRRLPTATRLVYDNYNALAIGYSATGRASDGIFSIAVFPRWVSLFFFQGVELDDPERLLAGTGNRVRHIVLRDAGDLNRPGVQALMQQALDLADPPLPRSGRPPLIIKSVSARQRPRRPSTRSPVGGVTRQALRQRR
jgi:hypothetical protein